MPGNNYTFHAYEVASGAGYFLIEDSVGTYNAEDYSDPGSPGDNLTQIGDIPNDHFTNGDYTGVFLGTATGGHGFISSQVGYDDYLYTTAHYNTGDKIYTTNTAFDLHTMAPVCFATGTLIKTSRGDIAIEELQEGEDIITASGEARGIKWIGHRRTDCAKHPKPKDVWPVLVEAGALGNNTPSRDLYLTPYHAVALTCGSEVLVPVHCLINGTTIRQVQVDEITYWHVELESHDIIVANGAAAESYLDTGNRSGFENNGGAVDLHPDFKPAGDADFCRPLVTSGPILSAIRASLPVQISSVAA